MRVRLDSAVRAGRTTRGLGGFTRSAWSAAAAVLVRVLTREVAARAVAPLARLRLVRAPPEPVALWCAAVQPALRINTVVPPAPASAGRSAHQVAGICPWRAMASPRARAFVAARAIFAHRVHQRSSAVAAESS